MTDLLMTLLFSTFSGVFWMMGQQLSHRETKHLCSDGMVKPGPMRRCSCRDEWVGLT